MAELHIHTKNQEQVLHVRDGLGLQAICMRQLTPLEFDCREADCGICIFQVMQGAENLSPPSEREADFLKAMRADPNERLACQTRVMGDVSIFVETPA